MLTQPEFTANSLRAIAPIMLSGVVSEFGVFRAARRSPSMPTSIKISCQNIGMFCGSVRSTKRKI